MRNLILLFVAAAAIGAQSLNTVAANIQKAFVGGTTLFPAGKTYACYTSTGTAFALAVSGNVATIFAGGDVSIATTGGALNPSIAPPADSPSGYYAVGWVMFTLYP